MKIKITKLCFLLICFLATTKFSYSQNVELSNKLIQQYNNTVKTHDHDSKNATFKPIARTCITSILLEVKKNWENLTQEAKTFFSPLTERPTLINEEIACTTNFCFHYTTTGTDAVSADDIDNSGIPDYVEQMADIFENVWVEYQNRNYTMPPLDGIAGGSEKYDIYISSINIIPNSFVYGYVSPENNIGNNPQSQNIVEVDCKISYMGMRNNYNSNLITVTEEEAIKVTAAHEFFHAVQFGTTSSTTNFISEATAAWSEDEIYPGIDDNLQYLTSIFDTPDIALNYNSFEIDNGTTYNSHWYGAWIFFRYLTEQTNPDIIRKIYNKLITNYEIQAIDNVLSTDYNSSFDSMFKKYLISLDVLSSSTTYAPYTYERANDYYNYLTNLPNVPPVSLYEANYNFTGNPIEHSSATSSTSNQTLMRLGADYFNINSDQNFKITCAVDNLLNESMVEITLLKYDLTNGTVVLDEGIQVGENLVFNVGDNLNYDAYSLLVYRKDYALDSQDNLDSEQYNFTIEAYNPLTNTAFKKDAISVFPNPSNSDFFIKGDSIQSYDLINSLGQSVKDSKLNENMNLQKISIADLSDGLYFLKLTLSNNSIVTKKLIIKKK